MKVDTSHSALVPRELVQDLARLHVPHRDGAVAAARRYPLSAVVLRPCAPDERLLEPGGRARQAAVHARLIGGEGADVVDDECGVEGVGREVVPVGRERQRRNLLSATLHRVGAPCLAH